MEEVRVYTFPMGEEYYEVDRLSYKNKEYLLLVNKNKEYLLLVNKNKEYIACIRKIVMIDNEEYLDKLSVNEYELVKLKFIDKNKDKLLMYGYI